MSENVKTYGTKQTSFDANEVHKSESRITLTSIADPSIPRVPTRTFAKRWLVLIAFCLLSGSNAFQWIQYSIINNIIVDYYGVSALAVNGTSIIWFVVYIPLIFPATWFLDKYGLRWSVLLGAFGNCLGAWIKCASASPDLFYVTFIGQTIVAISQVFILNVPPRLAAIWFGPKEVSTATSLGVFGNQFGCAIGFLVPPQIVTSLPDIIASSTPSIDSNFISNATHQLEILFYGTAAVTTAIFLLILLTFTNAPSVPPSLAQQISIDAGIESNYFQTLKRLVKNVNFMLMTVTYGLIAGGYYAFSTMLNQTILTYFPGEDANAGWIGVVLVLTGMVGSVAVGVWLDCTKLFKLTLLTVYTLSFAGMLVYTFTLSIGSLWVVFVVAAFLGFFLTGYLPLGFEFAIEITHPLPEGTVSGLLNNSSQVQFFC